MLFVTLLILGIASTTSGSSEVKISEGVLIQASRTVDLISQVVKVKVEYEITNKGTAPLTEFVHTIDSSEKANLAWISATESDKKTRLIALTVNVKGHSGSNFAFYKFVFSTPIAVGETKSLAVDYSVTQILVSHPAEITQAEYQFVKYIGSANVLSAYPISKETTTIKLGVKPLSYTEVNPVKFLGDKLVYGSYENQKPYSKNSITVHYENNSPFLVATNVERIIQVSQWGSISVEDRVEIIHKGAKLKGSFSRIDYQMDRRGNKQPVIKQLRAIIPSTATDIYYRDEIGNISTSEVQSRFKSLELELQPRFPLFGGWKTNYVIGYTLPTTGFIKNTGSTYTLKMKLLEHLFDNLVVENLLVKIILPESSKITELVTPYSVNRLPNQIQKNFLDTFGSPVIVLKKSNLISSHVKNFSLQYELQSWALLRAPIMAIIAFVVIYLAVFIWMRLDFTISPKSTMGSKDKKD